MIIKFYRIIIISLIDLWCRLTQQLPIERSIEHRVVSHVFYELVL